MRGRDILPPLPTSTFLCMCMCVHVYVYTCNDGRMRICVEMIVTHLPTTMGRNITIAAPDVHVRVYVKRYVYVHECDMRARSKNSI